MGFLCGTFWFLLKPLSYWNPFSLLPPKMVGGMKQARCETLRNIMSLVIKALLSCIGSKQCLWLSWIYFQFKYLENVPKKKLCHQESDIKLVFAIFSQIFISHQKIALQKLWKMLFIWCKKLFSFLRYSIFCISVFPSFSPCQPLL